MEKPLDSPSALARHVRRFTVLTESEESRLTDFFRLRTMKKREHRFSAGEVAPSLVFVESGLWRLYSLDENASEKTLQFGLEDWWIGDWDSFTRGVPSEFALQALEPSRAWLIDRESYEPLFEALPVMERYFRHVYQRGFAAQLRRVHLKDSRSASELYRHFSRAYPGFVDRVPQYMLASFLGFSPEFLSKIRARKE